MTSNQTSSNLNELISELKPKLCLNSKRIDKESVDKILNCEFFCELIELVLIKIDEDDAGLNVITILDYCFEQRSLLDDLYSRLSCPKSRYILIDYLTEKFKDKQLRIQRDDLNYLINLFRKDLNKPFDEHSEIDHAELVKLSDLMCLLSSTKSKCDYDKELINKELISLLIETLSTCHKLGKQATSDENPFKIISKLKQVNDPDSLSRQTFFGFKSNLIALLGNFAHSNKQIQDWIRELDGISLILDCTNIDARNPLIIQWSILALRNIMDKNKDNQDFVMNISKQSDSKPTIDLSKIF